jgi:sec-independent protein translocase protein TatC
MEYFLELRRRLILCFVATGLIFAVLCFFANPLYQLLTRPLLLQLPTHHLIATKIAATFFVPMKFTLIVSFFLLIPYFFYHLWSFVSPALYIEERKTVWYLLFPTVLLFYLGVLFAYFLVLPTIFKFFVQTTPRNVALLPDIGQYLDFAMQLLLAFGLAFEVPVIVVVLVRFNLYTLAQLKAARRYVIVLAFVVAMILTPPDIFSQFLLAIPLCLLYELGLVIASSLRPKD